MSAVDPGLRSFAEAATRASAITLEPLAGDGSVRKIFRARFSGRTWIAVANPLPTGRVSPDENEAFVAIARFLAARGVRVPAVLAVDLDRGYLLLEDLGDRRIYEVVAEDGWREGSDSHQDPLPLYEQAIEALLRMQAPGEPQFRSAWVSHPPYSEGFILEMEARYFHEELAIRFAGLDSPFSRVSQDCAALAHDAMLGLDTPRFVHRDYQSRNLMVIDSTVAVIDFQGGRLGPPEYDLAALLYDPYVRMPLAARDHLVARYLGGRARDPRFEVRFPANAANRMMQALGAMAKLGGRLGRTGFLSHIPAALANLAEILEARGGAQELRDLVARARDAVEGRCA